MGCFGFVWRPGADRSVLHHFINVTHVRTDYRSIGFLLPQILIRSALSEEDASYLEYVTIVNLHLLWTGLAVGLQAIGLGSAVLGLLWGISSGAALVAQYVISRWSEGKDNGRYEIAALVYVVGQFIPSVLGAEVSTSLLDIFIPLVSPLQ